MVTSSKKPSLGVYGPKSPDQAGSTEYIEWYLEGLGESFECQHMANRDWQDPYDFDYVLYNLGNNYLYDCAFRALERRKGPAIIHEHNCLTYYLEKLYRQELAPGKVRLLIRQFSKKYKTGFNSAKELIAFLEKRQVSDKALADRSLDIGVEKLYLPGVTLGFTHSAFYQRWLNRRYPGIPFQTIPFTVKPVTDAEIASARRYLDLEPETFLFGTFGFIGKHKRLEKLLKAWQSWATRTARARLLILGKNLSQVAIPKAPDIIYLDYVEDTVLFNGLIAACDCVIQLRYPGYGETSAIVSKVIANGGQLIISENKSNTDYKGYPKIITVKPDKHELANLKLAFDKALRVDPTRKNVENHSLEIFSQKITANLFSRAGAHISKTRLRRQPGTHKLKHNLGEAHAFLLESRNEVDLARRIKALLTDIKEHKRNLTEHQKYIAILKRDRDDLISYVRDVETDRQAKIDQLVAGQQELEKLKNSRAVRISGLLKGYAGRIARLNRLEKPVPAQESKPEFKIKG